MRDLSKVVQGLLLASPRALSSRDQLARLWLHESCRVFHDRLTCEGDRRQFKTMLVRGS
jgi:dynein heavy chain